jgi:hypothetical protein
MAETEKTTEAAYITTALAVLQLFLLGILSLCLVHCRTLFLQSHGMKHRLCGAIHLCLFSVGAWTASGTLSNQNNFLLFDFILGVSGLVTTLTAADDFPHRLVSNNRNGVYVQSGTLHETAIVTQAEMVEHSFYQALNLGQALYLHAMHRGSDSSNLPLWIRLPLLWLVTAPWLFRNRVPVSSFSHNWKFHQDQRIGSSRKDAKFSWELIMYKVKKAQYIIYKHCILHGINITVLVYPNVRQKIPYGRAWRIFWILLNASYVFEFFLQTLVKRRVIKQTNMLFANQILMFASSLAAMVVLKEVPVQIVLASITLNFLNRHHDVLNTMGIALTVTMWQYHFSKDK